MPRPPRLCACGQIVPQGQPCTCQREATRARNRRHDANRPTASRRGYNTEWRAARAEYLAHHPWCAFCGCKASRVDHVTPHRGDDRLFWSVSNWQPLCQPCHDRTKQRQERSARDA